MCLSPAATHVVSPTDRELVARAGCAVVNCSWARLDDVPFRRLSSGGDRLLPFLVASNPTKYGQWYTLSSAEALAAALYITGFKADALAVMACFTWGDSFWQLNTRYLDAYAACADAPAVLAAQQRFMDDIERERENRAKEDRSLDFPTSSSDGSDGSGDSEDDGHACSGAFRVRNPNAGRGPGGSEGGSAEEESSGDESEDEGLDAAFERTHVGEDT